MVNREESSNEAPIRRSRDTESALKAITINPNAMPAVEADTDRLLSAGLTPKFRHISESRG